ncbi:MAG: flagellar biosynthetic protein FliR [Gemmobacter sp.]
MTAILANLAELSGIGQDMAWAFFLVFLRVGAMLALMPAFGEQSVPQRVRLVIALAFTAVVTPAVAPALTPGPVVPAVAAEVIAGLLIGAGLRLMVIALQVAGTVAAQAASLTQVFGGLNAEPQPAMANLFVMAGLALAVMAGLHVRAAELVILSYDLLPPGRLPGPADVADWGLGRIARAFSLGFSLAAPFVIASVLYNAALGVINKAMPQLMVSFVGAPALTLGGLVLLAVATPLLLGVWTQALSDHIAAPFAVPP